MTDSPREALSRGLSQWRIVAAAWVLHGALVLYACIARFPNEDASGLDRLLVALGLASWLVLEVAVVSCLLATIELARPKGGLALAVDLVKSLGLSLLVTALLGSTAKFLSTGVHLKLSDFWYVYTSGPQIFQEAQPVERIAMLGLPVGILILAGLLFLAFRRWRGSARSFSPGAWVLTTALSALVVLGVSAASTNFSSVARSVVPEGHWVLMRNSRARLFPAIDASQVLLAKGSRIAPYAPDPVTDPLNVVLVMLESIPWKRTWLGAATRTGVTPQLEALATESVVFDRAYAASNHSCYAQLAILSSLHPRKFDHHDYYRQLEYPRTLIWDALAPAGYASAMFSCQNESWGNMLAYLNTPGLDLLRHSVDWPEEPHKGTGEESKVFEGTAVEAWKAWLRDRGEGPFFAYLNFQSNHFPYELPPQAERPYEPHEIDFAASYLSYPESKIPVMLNRFDNAQRFADRHVGEVIAFLKQRGVWDSTVLIVVSDHGEAFYEHGHPTHGTALFEEELRALFMMRIPGAEPRRVSQPVSLLDLAPTLLRALGLTPHGNFQGRDDILDPAYESSARPFFSTIQGLTQEDALVLGDAKLIVNLDHQTKSLYDLRADPGELVDLARERPDQLRELETVLGTFLERQVRYYDKRLWRKGFYPAKLP